MIIAKAPTLGEYLELKQEQCSGADIAVVTIPLHEVEGGEIVIEAQWTPEMIWINPVFVGEGEYSDI